MTNGVPPLWQFINDDLDLTPLMSDELITEELVHLRRLNDHALEIVCGEYAVEIAEALPKATTARTALMAIYLWEKLYGHQLPRTAPPPHGLSDEEGDGRGSPLSPV
jgi:hypothetical protein